MRMRTTVLTAALAVLLAAGLALGDTLYLKNGKTYEGKLVSESGGKVVFKTSFGELTFPADQVDRIEKGRTKLDEFKERLKAIPEDDYDAMLELARWCEEQKLIGQRLQVLRKVLAGCPDHPGAHRERGEIYRNGKWVKADGEPPVPKVEAGSRVEVPDTRASLVLPKDWKTGTEKAKATATGPDPWSVPPRLTVELGPVGSPDAAFPEKEGWAKPEKAEAAGLTGLRSRRDEKENGVGHAELLAVLSGSEGGLKVRLTCLAMEADAYAKAIDLVLGSLKFKAPPMDYTNSKYGYSMNLPKGEGWKTGEDKDNGFFLALHQTSEAVEYCRFLILVGAGEELSAAVSKAYDGALAAMKASGDIKEGDYTLGGEKGKIVDGTFLSGGIPVRQRVILVEHAGRSYLLLCTQHEFGVENTKEIWDRTISSFRFTD